MVRLINLSNLFDIYQACRAVLTGAGICTVFVVGLNSTGTSATSNPSGRSSA
jgi:hypothetical protein